MPCILIVVLNIYSCPYTVSGEHEPNVILKDNDIKYKIRLPRHTTENLLTQIRSDADFLYSIGVMDYSLLGEFCIAKRNNNYAKSAHPMSHYFILC